MSFSLSNEMKCSSDINQRSIGILRCSIILLGFLISMIRFNDRFNILPEGEIILNVIALTTVSAAILSFIGAYQNNDVQEKVQDYLSAMQRSIPDYDHVALARCLEHDRARRQSFLRRASFLFLSSLLLCLSLAVLPFATKFDLSAWWNGLKWSLQTVLPAIAFAGPIAFLLCGEIISLVQGPRRRRGRQSPPSNLLGSSPDGD